jgi:hypothetical protein
LHDNVASIADVSFVEMMWRMFMVVLLLHCPLLILYLPSQFVKLLYLAEGAAFIAPSQKARHPSP